jgi:predicted metal-dependent HD superfamily phosphohydrolase
MTLITPALRAELSALYSSPTRHYHSLTHVEALLALLDQHRHLFSDPEAVEAAIWFHDAIYNPEAKKPGINEFQSAQLAVDRLAGTVEPRRLEWIRKVIEATATHVVPEEWEDGEREDAAMFLDMDLSILGAEESEFDVYEQGVRKEYGFLSDTAWREGRVAVLERFLEREYIFHSEAFRGLFEERARANLRRSTEQLNSQGM